VQKLAQEKAQVQMVLDSCAAKLKVWHDAFFWFEQWSRWLTAGQLA
jgi:hypothetical protein